MSPGPDDYTGPLPGPLPGPTRGMPSPGVVAAISAVLCLVLFLTVGGLTQALNIGFGLWFTELFIFLAVPWVLLRFSGRVPARFVGLAGAAFAPAAYGFVLGVVNFFAVVVPLQFLSTSIAPEWMRKLYDASHIFKEQTPFELVLIVGGVGLAAPVCEEIFFRGVVLRGLMPPNFKPLAAVLVTSFVFSAFHMDPVGFLARFELGALFGLLFLRTGSLWPGVAAHAANNLVSTVLYFAYEKSGEKEAEPQLAQILLLAAIGAMVLAAVLSLPRRFPSLLASRPLEDAPAAARPGSLLRLASPWLAAAMTALLLLFGLDSRGIALKYWDYKYPLPELEESAPPAEREQREELSELRARARRGEVPTDEYAAKRRQLAAKGSGISSPSAPVPPSPQ
ncbi:MAG: CPBP family glutamic-type intramembrane protease [Myxococcaceae bacterium]